MNKLSYTFKRLPVMCTIIATCTFAFIYQHVLGFGIRDFVTYPFYVDGFQLYTIISHMFSHGGIIHFGLNMFVLYSFADLEKTLGHRQFIILYVLAGLGAYLLQSIGAPSPTAMVGASGCIAGVIGAYTIMNPHGRVVIIFLPFKSFPIWKLMAVVMAIEIVLGFTVTTGIAHLAHVGGAITGMIYILATKPLERRFMKNRLKGTKLGRKIFK